MRLLVRHGHAGSKHDWDGPDSERPLSESGWAQAEALVDLTAGLPIRRLETSPTLRCRQTLIPLAAALGLDLEPSDDLGLDGDVDRLARRLWRPETEGAVLCTHGEVLDELFGHLRARHALDTADEVRWEKGSAWLLAPAPGHRFQARYLPPFALSHGANRRR